MDARRLITVDEARERWPCPQGYHLGSAWSIACALTRGYDVEDVVDVGPPGVVVDAHVVARFMHASFGAFSDFGDGEQIARLEYDAATMAIWFGGLVDGRRVSLTSRELREIIERDEQRRAAQ